MIKLNLTPIDTTHVNPNTTEHIIRRKKICCFFQILFMILIPTLLMIFVYYIFLN